MASGSNKSSKSVTVSRNKRQIKGKREPVSHLQPARELNASLQARIVKRTEQRDEANRKLNQTRTTFDTLFQANPIPTALMRLDDDTFINVNVAFLKYFDLELSQVIGHTAQELKL